MTDRDRDLGPGSRRRARASGRHGLLIEREQELAAIDSTLAGARDGRGGVLLIDAPAGKGKTRLLAVAGDTARHHGMRVLGAQGTELEREFPYGVAVQLLEPLWMAADPDTRARLTAGPAMAAGELLERGLAALDGTGDDEVFTLIHGLTWMLRNLVELPGEPDGPGGVAIIVDDAHWADRPSLRFLAYLAGRVADLPIALIVSIRTAEPALEPRALSAMATSSGAVILRPDALSAEGMEAIVRERFPAASRSFVHACATVTAGNPFLLACLLDQVAIDGLAPDPLTAGHLGEMTPAAVLSAAIARLDAMTPEAGRMARALAVLGDGAPISDVAALADVSLAAAGAAADLLATMRVVHPGTPLSFVHPLIHAAIRASISPMQRGLDHRRAAAILTERGAGEEQVAAQLMLAPPEGDAVAQGILRTAGAKALASGEAETAVRLLERALGEAPAAGQSAELQRELALASAAAGLPVAAERLLAAIDLAPPAHEVRLRLELALVRALLHQGRSAEAAERLLALEPPTGLPGELADEYDAAFISAARQIPGLRPRACQSAHSLMARAEHPLDDVQRHALAEAALLAALAGEPRADVLALIERAWHESNLPGRRHETSWRPITSALLVLDELERDLELCAAGAASAAASDLGTVRTVVASARASALLEQGWISAARDEARAALAEAPEEWSQMAHFRTAYTALAISSMYEHEFEPAETALSILDFPEVSESVHAAQLFDARARLRMAQLRPQEALADALEAGRRAEIAGLGNPGAVPWRSTAALAHVALGDQKQALALASDSLELARSLGAHRVVIRALRVQGLASRGEARLSLLREAVELAAAGPRRLEGIEALLSLGAALRRANRRAAAREPLQQALELARQGGLTLLAAAARTELGASAPGSRPVSAGGVAALTPSEHRVATLAAGGLTTREMAESLFVSPKTIEFHLRQTYRKLGISSRPELAVAMAGQDRS